MKKNHSWIKESFIFLVLTGLFFGVLGHFMGGKNMMSTIMSTAHDLILNTVFYLMGIIVLAGALSSLFSEFGVLKLLEKILTPLMKPLFNLPGVAALGAVMTFMSDNPAIMTLSKDRQFSSYFKKYQMASLINFGTAVGMGFVVLITMIGYDTAAALTGLAAAFVGAVISTRLFQRSVLKADPSLDSQYVPELNEEDIKEEKDEESQTGVFMRFLNALLDGGKKGVELSMSIIPGVVIITTFVIMLTFGPGESGEYTGGAGEGVPVLPWLAEKVHWIFEWLFGLTDMKLIAFPMTALGAVGAALGLLPTFNAAGALDGNAVAVFTAIGMVWSGFLSTHTALMDSIGFRKFVPKAILTHTVAGLIAGALAHLFYLLLSLL